MFKQAIDVLDQTQEAEEDRQYIEHIAETIGSRLKNLGNYLRGERSDFCSYRKI